MACHQLCLLEVFSGLATVYRYTKNNRNIELTELIARLFVLGLGMASVVEIPTLMGEVSECPGHLQQRRFRCPKRNRRMRRNIGNAKALRHLRYTP